MKKILQLIPAVALLPALFANFAIKENKETYAASGDLYENSKLPTTINLNDYSESEIRAYYSDLTSKSDNDKKGEALLASLKTILKKDQKYYSYDISSGKPIWQMYEITDRDWEKSPASELGSKYDATTNTITGYTYLSGTKSDSNYYLKEGAGYINPYLHSYYMDYTQENQVQAWGNHNQDGYGINREHLWPKSEGFGTEGSGDKGGAGARGDPMHLVAANGWANNQHNNNFYGYVDTTKEYVDCSTKYSSVGHNLLGVSKTAPVEGVKVFEPQDADKGDVARAMFYMVARYNDIAGDDEITIDNPNLALTDDLTKWEKSGFTSSKTKMGYMAMMSDLLEWNKLDPVDDYEIHRNNLLHRNFTNNRNPFIDFPEWADIIWGGQSGVANPQSDSLNGKTATNVNAISVFTVADVDYGTAVAPSATAEKGGNVTFTYSTSENGTFTEAVPTDAGTYYCKATSETVGEFEGTSSVKSFRIIGTKNEVVGFIVEDYKEGNVIAPKATSTNGERVKFTYSTSEDGEFTETVPTEPGTYYVKATTVGQGEYESQFAIKSFKIMEKSFIEKISDENGKVFGLFPPVVFFIICGVVVLLILIIIILILTKSKKKTKNKIKKGAKNVAKELGIPVPKTTSSSSSKSSSSSTAKKASSSSTAKKSTTSKSSSTSKSTKNKNGK